MLMLRMSKAIHWDTFFSSVSTKFTTRIMKKFVFALLSGFQGTHSDEQHRAEQEGEAQQ